MKLCDFYSVKQKKAKLQATIHVITPPTPTQRKQCPVPYRYDIIQNIQVNLNIWRSCKSIKKEKQDKN